MECAQVTEEQRLWTETQIQKAKHNAWPSCLGILASVYLTGCLGVPPVSHPSAPRSHKRRQRRWSWRRLRPRSRGGRRRRISGTIRQRGRPMCASYTAYD